MTASTDRHMRNVRTRYAREIDAMRRYMRRWLTAERVDQLGSAAAQYVVEYATVHGHAPSRREAIAALGLAEHVQPAPEGMPSRFRPQWQAAATDLVFLRLRDAGWIDFTSAPRSLRPGAHLPCTGPGANPARILTAAS